VLKELVSRDGSVFVRGRRLTGFSDSEETKAGLADVVPELLEDVLVNRGAIYSKSDEDFAPHVVVDGLLVTGQNPASSAPAAQQLLEVLNQSTRDTTSVKPV
jgi:putative intracellular protease/amidase